MGLDICQLGNDIFAYHRRDALLLVGVLAGQPSAGETHRDFVERRLPDMLLFGIVLSTVMGQKLPETAIQALEWAPRESLVA